ncbi:hypothetical protein WA026_003685 [Henosepilachna vigintioctopunctata]
MKKISVLKEKCDADSSLQGVVSEMQEMLWSDFFSKYFDAEKSKSNLNRSFDNYATIQRQIIDDVPTQNINLDNKTFQRHILKGVRQIIEQDLKSDLKYYCIKAVSSFIKRDEELSFWINLMKNEMKNISRKVHMKYIEMYISKIIPLPSKEKLFHLFENELQSKLKYYLELRESVPNEQESLNVLIQDEWNRIRREGVSEKFICLYCFILVG